METTSRSATPNHHSALSIASPHPTDLGDHGSSHGNSLVADLERAAASSSESAAVAAAAAALDSSRNNNVLSSSHASHAMSLFAFSGPLMTSAIEARSGEPERAASPSRAAAALSALLAGDRPLDSSKHGNHISVPPSSEPLRSVAQSLQSLHHIGSPPPGTNSLHSAGLESLNSQSNTDSQLMGDSSLGVHTPQTKYATVSDLRTPNSDSLMDGAHSLFDTTDHRMQHALTSRSQESPKSPSNKRHKCQFCSTVFTRHHNLKSHLLTHSQEKPFRCESCHSCFRRLHDLKRHSKLHTGEKPHKCNHCGRPFARGDALARHTKGPNGCAGRRSSCGHDDSRLGRGGMRPGINGVGASPSPMEGIELHHTDSNGISKLTTSISTDASLAALTDSFGRSGTAYSTPTPSATMYSTSIQSQIDSRDLPRTSGICNINFSAASLPYTTTLAESPPPMSPSHGSAGPNQQSRTSPYSRMLGHNGFQISQSNSSLQSIPTDPRMGISSGAATPIPFGQGRSPLVTNESLVSSIAMSSVGADTSTAASPRLDHALTDDVMAAHTEHDDQSSHSQDHVRVQLQSQAAQTQAQLQAQVQAQVHAFGQSTDVNTHLLSVIKDLETQVGQIRSEYEKRVKDLEDEVTVLQGQLLLRQPSPHR